MTAEKAAEVLRRLEQVELAMKNCDTIIKLLDTQIQMYVGTQGKDQITFSLRAPAIRTVVAGALKANYNILRDEHDELAKKVQAWS